MADRQQQDLIVPRRVPYADKFVFLGRDWTGSSFKMQVRQFKDTTGTPFISLTAPSGLDLGYAGTATVSAHITAGRLTSDIYTLINPNTGSLYVAGDSVTLSLLAFGVNVSTIAGVPLGGSPSSEIGDDVECYYDVIRIPSAGNSEIVMDGKFTVLAGVTIP